MRRVLAALLWTVTFLLLLVGFDQLLVRVQVTSPAPLAVVTFYRDLRSRVLEVAKGLMETSAPPARPAKPAPPPPAKGAPPATVEGLIEQHRSRPAIPLPPPKTPPAKAQPNPPAKDAAPRYVYADDGGELHFATTLAEIPDRYRERARLLGQ